MELLLVDTVAYPIKCMSMAQDQHCVTVSLASPTAVELLIRGLVRMVGDCRVL